ncbi:FecR domain-containing protein [Rhizobium sp. BK376]|uniref:FecR family protein n=1 Tax=Rhizobium sp. BK376 TaxID=2512149 RepID=UPI00105076F0|nr:FecR domain-containing protein [Rhizobium sp. BK376]TCR80149.1 FecR family protein [Rhizobium sp. BK376]
MLHLRAAAFVLFSVILLAPLQSKAAEEVGQAVLIKTEVSGDGGPLAVDDRVHRDERIRTSQSGLGQFTFRDGTKLAVGWGSSVVIDKFVFDDSGSVKKLTIKAAKGTFRWISGNSNSSAYQIVTPAGTIGVRGTAFDFYVDRNGRTAVVLLNGAVQFCGAGGCKQLKQKCDVVVASPSGGVSDARRVNRDVLRTLGNQQALPFLSGDQQLAGQLGFAGSGGCGLATATRERPNGISPRAAPPSAPAPQRAPDTPTAPSSPAAPSAPAAPQAPSTPNTPDPPSTPGKPNGPDKDHDGRGRHHDRDHDHDHDRDGRHDHGWGRDNHGRGRGDHDGGRNNGGDHHR